MGVPEDRYAAKLTFGYVVTAAFIAAVGVVTSSVGATILAAVSGLLALGSITGTATQAAVREIERQTLAVADGDLDREVWTTRTDELGSVYGAVDEMRRSLADRIDDLETAQAEAEAAQEQAEAARREAAEQAEEYQRIAERYAETMQRAADGDISQRVDVAEDYPAMATIGEGFNTTMTNLAAALGEVESFATRVRDDVDQVHQGTTDLRATVDDAADRADTISELAREQRSQVEAASTDLDDLSATAEEVAATVETVAEKSATASDASEDARAGGTEAIGELEAVQQDIETAVDKVEALTDSTEEITEIVDIIRGIAEETNMLALNASIEAARADGEGADGAGDGFAVVAEEVKQLAGETQSRADDIADMVAEVRTATDAAVASIRRTEERVVTGTETAKRALTDIESIADSVAEIDAGVAEINDATATQAETVQTTAAALDDITDISRRAEDAATDIRGRVGRQQTVLDEITEAMETVDTTSRELRAELDRFDTGGVDAAGHGAEGVPAGSGGSVAATDGGEP